MMEMSHFVPPGAPGTTGSARTGAPSSASAPDGTTSATSNSSSARVREAKTVSSRSSSSPTLRRPSPAARRRTSATCSRSASEARRSGVPSMAGTLAPPSACVARARGAVRVLRMIGRVSDLRALVRRPYALRMLLSALVGRLPEAMVPLGLLLLVRHEGGSYATAGAVAGAFAVGAAVGGPLLGRGIDRVGQSMVLIVVAVARSAALAGIVVAAPSSLAVTAVLCVAAGALTPPL